MLLIWLALDRLDEAFIGYPDVEIPALRALLRTYLDLLAFSNISLKIFVRHDMFTKISRGGFVNLTHVNARKADIMWYEEDLRALICRRIRGNMGFLNLALEAGSGQTRTDDSLFQALFPALLGIRANGGKRLGVGCYHIAETAITRFNLGT